MFRKGLMQFTVLAAVAALLGPSAHAESRSYSSNFEHKLMLKAKTALVNADELGLSDKQVTSIRELKQETKKTIVQQDASIEIATIDIYGKLYEEKIDTASIHTLIDQQYGIKAVKQKTLFDAYAKLKALLDEDQWDELHELLHSGSSGNSKSHHGR